MTRIAMTIAGSDPSGGAGLQADLKTFHQHGLYGTSIATLLTVQNTQEVAAVQILKPDFVVAQLDAVLGDFTPQAAKTGALGHADMIAALAERAADFQFPLVVDPVMISKHGAPLLDAGAVDALKTKLLPHSLLVTPNLAEAASLAGMPVDDEASMGRAAAAIARFGVPNVLVKGGHLRDGPVDVLWSADELHRFPTARIETKHTHGTGCVLSAAITARLARGDSLPEAVAGAKRFVTRAIETNPGIGGGFGPLNLFADV